MAAVTSTPKLSKSIADYGSLLTVCLECGHFIHGIHPDVSFHFSEDHMCEGNSSNLNRDQLFIECINLLANKAYTDETPDCGSDALPFDVGKIKLVLDEIFLQSKERHDETKLEQDDSFVVGYGTRLTVCLKCGHFIHGKHADVSFHFSEEHMCKKSSSELVNQNQLIIKCLSLLAKKVYTDGAPECDSNAFDVGKIKAALDEILLEHMCAGPNDPVVTFVAKTDGDSSNNKSTDNKSNANESIDDESTKI